MDKKVDKALALLKSWAETRVASGEEPPWAWYQYMKLIETVAAIQRGRAVVAPAALGSLSIEPPAVAPPAPAAQVAAIEPRQRRRRRRADPQLPM